MKLTIILAASSVLAWWLSGYDSLVTGENHTADLKRRVMRSAVTLVLILLASGFLFIPVAVLLALIWTGCLSELFARAFHNLLDSPDSRKVDPKELNRELDSLAALVQQGRNEEALQLGAKLRASAEGSALALEAMLFRVYDQMIAGQHFSTSPTLAEAQRLCGEGRYLEAESRLGKILKREPGNPAAALKLLRLYAENLRSYDKADALLRALEKRSDLPPGFLDYVRHCIGQWSAQAGEGAKSEGIECLLVEQKATNASEHPIDLKRASLSELLAAGHLGTAIEILEGRIKEHPQDFDSRVKLAEAYGLYCGNLGRAKEIISKIEANSAFSPEQVRKAKTKLLEWRARQPTNAF